MTFRLRMVLFHLALCLFIFPSIAWSVPQEIGSVIAVQGAVQAESAEGLRPLQLTSPVHAGETIISGPDGRTQVLFLDDTVLAVGPSSRITLDSYVFDQDDQNLLFRMGEGAFRVITGKIAEQNPDKFAVETPLAVIGIRGTTIGFLIRANQETIYGLQITPPHVIQVQNKDFPDDESDITEDGTAVDVFANQPPGPPRPTDPDELDDLDQATGMNGGALNGGDPGGEPGSGDGEPGAWGDSPPPGPPGPSDPLDDPQAGGPNTPDMVDDMMADLTMFPDPTPPPPPPAPEPEPEPAPAPRPPSPGPGPEPEPEPGPPPPPPPPAPVEKDYNSMALAGGNYVGAGPPAVGVPPVGTAGPAYMKYGMWDVTGATLSMWDDGTISGTAGAVNIAVTHNYGIWGEKTADFTFIMNNTPVNYATGGGVSGLYYANADNFTGAVAVQGDFSADVTYDVGTGNFQVMNFSISSTSAGHPVITIEGASGAFTDGNFVINTTTQLFDTNVADAATARGSIYGPDAEAIGGVWAIEKYTGGAVLEGAYGYFHGAR